MGKALAIDEEACIGCGTCVAIAAKSFKLKDNGKAELILPPGDSEALVQEAVEACPTAAIVDKNEK